MLFKEFIAGTGCVANQHNYGLFEMARVAYNCSGAAKEEIYEQYKKFVDNNPDSDAGRYALKKEYERAVIEYNDCIDVYHKELLEDKLALYKEFEELNMF